MLTFNWGIFLHRDSYLSKTHLQGALFFVYVCAVVCLFKNEFECIVECEYAWVNPWSVGVIPGIMKHTIQPWGNTARKKRWDGSLYTATATELYIDSVYVHMQKGSQRQMVQEELVYRSWQECGGFIFLWMTAVVCDLLWSTFWLSVWC